MTIPYFKQIFTLVLIVLLINVFSFSFASEHWAKDIIDDFVSKGFVENQDLNYDSFITKKDANNILNKFYSNEKEYFDKSLYEESIPREESCALIVKAMNIELSGTSPNFIDNDKISVWASPYIATAQKEGLIIGYPDKSFGPQSNTSYAEFVTMLSRIKGTGGRDEPELLDLIDDELTNIEIGIVNYSQGEIKAVPVGDELFLSSRW